MQLRPLNLRLPMQAGVAPLSNRRASCDGGENEARGSSGQRSRTWHGANAEQYASEWNSHSVCPNFPSAHENRVSSNKKGGIQQQHARSELTTCRYDEAPRNKRRLDGRVSDRYEHADWSPKRTKTVWANARKTSRDGTGQKPSGRQSATQLLYICTVSVPAVTSLLDAFSSTAELEPTNSYARFGMQLHLNGLVLELPQSYLRIIPTRQQAEGVCGERFLLQALCVAVNLNPNLNLKQ